MANIHPFESPGKRSAKRPELPISSPSASATKKAKLSQDDTDFFIDNGDDDEYCSQVYDHYAQTQQSHPIVGSLSNSTGSNNNFVKPGVSTKTTRSNRPTRLTAVENGNKALPFKGWQLHGSNRHTNHEPALSQSVESSGFISQISETIYDSRLRSSIRPSTSSFLINNDCSQKKPPRPKQSFTDKMNTVRHNYYNFMDKSTLARSKRLDENHIDGSSKPAGNGSFAELYKETIDYEQFYHNYDDVSDFREMKKHFEPMETYIANLNYKRNKNNS